MLIAGGRAFCAGAGCPARGGNPPGGVGLYAPTGGMPIGGEGAIPAPPPASGDGIVWPARGVPSLLEGCDTMGGVCERSAIA